MQAGLIDIHHHLLDGMDDGPSTFEETIRMLHRAVQEGVTCIAATPHVTPGQVKFSRELYQEKLAHVQAYVQEAGLPLTICQGAEVYYTSSTVSYLQKGVIPTLGNSWHVLVEFHPHDTYATIRHAAANVNNAGYSMVLAHAERYRALRWGDRLAELKADCGLKVQMNSSAILKAHQGWGDRWIRRMLREGLTDIVSSDSHNTSTRFCTLGQCAEMLSTVYGPEAAKRLCADRALRILHEKDDRRWVKAGKEGEEKEE